jgi:hypothetical protein
MRKTASSTTPVTRGAVDSMQQQRELRQGDNATRKTAGTWWNGRTVESQLKWLVGRAL